MRYSVSPRGVEPLFQPSEGYALSIELWGLETSLSYSEIIDFVNCGGHKDKHQQISEKLSQS